MIKFNIKKLRLLNGMTQKELSEMAEIRYPTLQFYEYSKAKTVSIKHLASLCEILNCGLSDLITFIPDEDIAATEQRKSEDMKLNPEYIEKYIEKKTKRVNLVFQPSLYEAAKVRAIELGTSLNDYIHQLIEADLKK